MKRICYFTFLFTATLFACNTSSEHDANHKGGHSHSKEESHSGHSHHGGDTSQQTVHYEQKKHLQNVKQLTFGGDNAEAYFSYDDKHLTECDVDGSNLRQVANFGGANWTPYMHPSGKEIVFSSNHYAESGRQFNLFKINVDGIGLEQVTFDNVFDSFPMFSYYGKHLVFASKRNHGGTRDTNVFYSEWVN